MKSLHTAHATSTRGGRGVGTSATDDSKVSVNFSTPTEMGGDGGPQPRAAVRRRLLGLLLGATNTAARREGKKLPEEATMTAAISFVDREEVDVKFSVA